MPKKSKNAPALSNLSSTFALIDVKKGRKTLSKVVGKGYKVPFTIKGFIQAGHRAVGPDDGVSIEFCAGVTSATFGNPELAFDARSSARTRTRS
jgi:hypothetical protein